MNKRPLMCELCKEGLLQDKQGLNTVTYKSVTRELLTDFCECGTCGVETTLPHQTRMNKLRMTAFKQEIDGLATSNDE